MSSYAQMMRCDERLMGSTDSASAGRYGAIGDVALRWTYRSRLAPPRFGRHWLRTSGARARPSRLSMTEWHRHRGSKDSCRMKNSRPA